MNEEGFIKELKKKIYAVTKNAIYLNEKEKCFVIADTISVPYECKNDVFRVVGHKYKVNDYGLAALMADIKSTWWLSGVLRRFGWMNKISSEAAKIFGEQKVDIRCIGSYYGHGDVRVWYEYKGNLVALRLLMVLRSGKIMPAELVIEAKAVDEESMNTMIDFANILKDMIAVKEG